MTASKTLPRATMLSASSYDNADVLERERAEIFAREWLYAADVTQLVEPGNYVATTIAGFPLLIISEGARLRAFHNVCRHRGGPVAWDGEGACKVIVCRYHGWSYNLDGALQAARDFGGEELDTAGLSLHDVRVEAWRGLVFVNLNPQAVPLVDWLGSFAEECAAYPLESFRPHRRSSHHIAANWKVYAENYQEGYHIPLVHPGLNKQIDARRYEVEVRDGYCVHRVPTRDGSVTSGVWLWKFPGLALNVYPDGMCVESYGPAGATGTRVNYAFFFTEGTPADESEAAIASSDQILEEDRIICEAVQRNMSSGLYDAGVLSPRHENGVAYFQSLVLEAMEGGRAALR